MQSLAGTTLAKQTEEKNVTEVNHVAKIYAYY